MTAARDDMLAQQIASADKWHAEWSKVRNENQRLREALDEIASVGAYTAENCEAIATYAASTLKGAS